MGRSGRPLTALPGRLAMPGRNSRRSQPNATSHSRYRRAPSAGVLAGATGALVGKTDRAFDSTWAHLANDWLVTLLLDNNTHVKPLVSAPQLERITREHTTWFFHQSVEPGD